MQIENELSIQCAYDFHHNNSKETNIKIEKP